MNDVKLSVLLLGAPVVQWGEQIIHIQRRNQRALLYYLAGHTNPVSRADLMLLLWPEASTSDARRHLRENLSKLRSELPDPDLIVTERDHVSLDFERVYVDLHEFQDLVNENRRAAGLVPRNEPLPFSVYDDLARAVRLWRGDALLAGFDLPDTENYDHWVSDTSQLLDISRQFCLLRLADHSCSSGDLQECLRWLQMAARHDEYNSDLHYRILNTLAGLGQQAEISSYCDYLDKLYGSFEEMPAVIAQTCRSLKFQVQQAAAAYPFPTPQHPMVGRSKELLQLRQAYNRGGVAVVLGESGVGKSRLGYEFYRQLDPAPRLIFIDCLESYRSLPFQPLIAALRGYISPTEWEELSPSWRAHLAVLLPELTTLFTDMPPARKFSAEDNRPQIFEALYQFLSGLARKQRLLVIMDDAQWCDVATYQALDYLTTRGLFAYPNFSVYLSRFKGINPENLDAAENSRRKVPETIIQLSQLNQSEIQELTRLVLGKPLLEKEMDQVAHDTGGNPLYLIEWLRAWSYHRGGGENLAPAMGGLHSLMRDRLNNITPLSRQVLAASAVLGGPFTPEEVETVSALSEIQVANSLEELERASLLRISSDQIAYTFIHDKIREVLLMDLSLARQRLLHIRAARMLQNRHSSGENPDSARIAAHYEEGGEPLAAIYAWIDAARHAQHMYSKAEMDAAFQRADNLVKIHERILPDEAIYRLYRTWGSVAHETTYPDEAQRIYSLLLRYGEMRRNRLMMGAAQRGLAAWHLQTGSPDAALEAAEKAVLLLEPLPPGIELVNALNVRGNIHATMGRFDPARRDLERSVALSEHSNETDMIRLRSLAKMMLSMVSTLGGRPLTGIEYARQSRADARRIDSAFAESSALVLQVMAEFYSFHYADAVQHVKEGLKLSEPLGYWHNTAYLHMFYSFVLLARGELDECWNENQAVQQISLEHTLPDLQALIWLVRGEMHRYLMNFSAALECIREGERVVLGVSWKLEHMEQEATLLGYLGQMEKCTEVFAQVRNEAEQGGLWMVYIPATSAWLGLFAMILPVEQMQREIDSILQKMAGLELEEMYGFVQYAQALVALKAGNVQLALELMERFNSYSHHSEVPWLKVINLTLQKIIGDAIGRPLPAAVKEEMQQLLVFLDKNIQNPDLRPPFENFRNQIQNLLT